MTRLRLLKLLFDDVLIDVIACYTKLYSHREKGDISFEITNEKICLFLSMLLFSGCHKLPDRKMFWVTISDNFVLARSDSIPRNTFGRILWNLDQLRQIFGAPSRD